jgi:ABC-type nitrate/sulfonate/bicarbonate transport system substrate-binding protein
MCLLFRNLLAPLFTLFQLSLSLRIASSLAWIEHTPQPYAINNFYKGSTAVTLTSGGVADLASDPKNFDLAANAETQGLKQYANHRNIRLIYVICEVAYRVVADRRKGITKLSDLKGKKIGTFGSSSASVFIHNMMSSVGVHDNEYTTSSGKVCMKTPCASDTMPAQLKSGTIDAFGVWEPAVELGAQALGSNAITFQNATIHREVYSLYSTTDALNNPAKRKDIVEFLRALNKTLDVFAHQPKEKGVYGFVSKQVGVDEPVVESVWADHKWSGTWGSDLIEFIVEEDKYLAGTDKRSVVPRAELEKFLDTSVIDEL